MLSCAKIQQNDGCPIVEDDSEEGVAESQTPSSLQHVPGKYVLRLTFKKHVSKS